MKQKRILVTGASGDLGKILIPLLVSGGNLVRSIDPISTPHATGEVAHGSILDRQFLKQQLEAVDLVLHIAAWHGFHEVTGQKSRYEFWDLNMTGTFNLLQGCRENGIKKFLFVSSTSVDEGPSFYGLSKRLGEELCREYSQYNGLDVLSIRPRAFIPHTNRNVYSSYLEWAKWFAKGAIHIDDVAQALNRAVQYLFGSETVLFDSVEIDGKHDLNNEDIARWEKEGWSAFLQSRFPQYVDQLSRIDFAPNTPPTYKDNSKAHALIGYVPDFGFEEMLKGLIALR